MSRNLDEIKNEIKENVNKMKKDDNIEKVYQIIKPLRKKMDHYDKLFKNIKDGIKRVFSSLDKKSLIILDLDDIIDGFNVYSPDDKEYTINKLEEIAEIHDRTFWEKIISVLRAS